MFQPRPLFWLRASQTVSNSVVLSAKQSSRTSNFNVFCLTRLGIEPPTSRMPDSTTTLPSRGIFRSAVRYRLWALVMVSIGEFTVVHGVDIVVADVYAFSYTPVLCYLSTRLYLRGSICLEGFWRSSQGRGRCARRCWWGRKKRSPCYAGKTGNYGVRWGRCGQSLPRNG